MGHCRGLNRSKIHLLDLESWILIAFCIFSSLFSFFLLANLLPIVPAEEHPNTVNSSSPAEEPNQFPGISSKNLLLLFVVILF